LINRISRALDEAAPRRAGTNANPRGISNSTIFRHPPYRDGLAEMRATARHIGDRVIAAFGTGLPSAFKPWWLTMCCFARDIEGVTVVADAQRCASE
jgi:class 3 adenylate cyclase